MYFVGSVLVRGQGTTEGFHRFSLPVPGTVIPRLLDDDTRDALGRLARELLADAREAEYALRDALKVLSRGGFAPGDSRTREDDTTQRWALAAASGFAREWSGRYFEQLWKSVDRPSAELRGEWREALVALAREQLRAAEMRLPRPAGRRYRAIVDANGALQGRLKKKGLIPDSVMTERHEVA
jgi:CRISPR system Cascade subunit CasA